MEVGAVKQAFNNEVILLKKNLQQAKIQVIHKLTRKAKTLTDKKAPDPIKEKFKRKAELAIKEVLVIKKIKARDIARFIVTHKGKLNEYLNKPIVDENKACARLLLHKTMTNKYNVLRNKFGNVSINDLLMSRQERRKLKKEAREKQKEKKKKGTANKTGGDWNVATSDNSKVSLDLGSKVDSVLSDDEYKLDVEDNSETGLDEDNIASDGSAENHEGVIDQKIVTDDESEVSDDEDISQVGKKFITPYKSNDKNGISTNNINVFEEKNTKKLEKKLNDHINKNLDKKSLNKNANKKEKSKEQIPESINTLESSVNITKKVNKKLKDGNKNKNLNEKLLKRNFNKKTDDEPFRKVMVADPFFVTSTGDNYMSLVEPRQPDELKEEHKTGNRKYRRAVMFGHVPVSKVKRNNAEKDFEFTDFNNKSEERHSKFNANKFNQEKQFRIRNDKEKTSESSVPEKLHPSWEAKKRQSSILPFKGKKIMFDE